MIKANKAKFAAIANGARLPQYLSDAELLALVTDSPLEECRDLLKNEGGLRAFADNKKGLQSKQQVAMLALNLELSRRFLSERMMRGDVLGDPDAVRHYLVSKLRDLQSEVFACVFLDCRHRIIAFEEMFNGTIDGASVHPREVVKRSLHHNAAAVIFAHNHPSGVAEPSAADERITAKLKDALALVDVRVLDHFVIGDSVVSFAERGLL